MAYAKAAEHYMLSSYESLTEIAAPALDDDYRVHAHFLLLSEPPPPEFEGCNITSSFRLIHSV
jgi:hypothetical protein